LALAFGASCGLMFATKETWIIAVAAMAAAAVRIRSQKTGVRSQHLVFAGLAFLLVGVLLLSSFFTHPRGIVDSVLAYGTYFARGVGVNTTHVHPWYFYFVCLRGEALVAVFALIGLAASNTSRFLKLYTVLMVLIYCAIPYKVPWNVLSFWHAAILVAGIGMVRVTQTIPKPLAAVLVGVVVIPLGLQARDYSFQHPASPSNPWVYAHTGSDVFEIVKQLKALSAVQPDGRVMPIQIFTRENLWPLPFYLRKYPNARWWNGVSDSAPIAPVILATPDMEPALMHRIYEVPPPGHREMYVPMFDRYVELRPRVEVRGYVAKSLWDLLP
jgi:hypothetical protein